MLKKALSLLLLVLLALTLAACDGDSAPLNESGGGASTPSADSSAQGNATAQGGATGNETVSPEESNPTPNNKIEPSTPEDTTPEDGYIDLPKVEF